MPGCAIAVMAKAPRPGYCKTRLCPPLSPDQAVEMSRAFLRDITANLVEASMQAPITPFIAYAPAGHEALFDGILAPGTQLVLADGSGEMPAGVEGFGKCLLHAVRALLARGYDSVCVLNADSPTLPTDYLVRAARNLAAPGAGAVMGAAEDGGYYLLGMRTPLDRLFANMPWSTEAVADRTRTHAYAAGIPLAELPPWYDVDDAAALRRLLSEIEAPDGHAFRAPATAACIGRLNLAEQMRQFA
jgi:rSAM/selenodomain-associated transferase 1